MLQFGHYYPFVKCQTPTQEGRDNMRLRFPVPRFDVQKFQQIAELSDIDWDEIILRMLLEDFQLRYRQLLNGDLTKEE